MSSAKRRRKAKLACLKRLDENHGWLYYKTSPRRDGPRAIALWWNCIVPLGDKLEKQKAGAWDTLPRWTSVKGHLAELSRARTAAQLDGGQGEDA